MRSTSPHGAIPATTPAVSLVFTTVLSHGPLTRTETARRTMLSSATVTKAVRRPVDPVRVDEGRPLFSGVKVDNDVRVLTVAEQWSGAGGPPATASTTGASRRCAESARPGASP